MKTYLSFFSICAIVIATTSSIYAGVYGDTPDARHAWAVHDNNRPAPAIISAEPACPPSDAIVLFDGTSLDAWLSTKDQPCKWRIIDGAMEVVPKTGNIYTKQAFGDAQIHIEWATPVNVSANQQQRGNSGVFLMGMHEVQILDSFDNPVYADGQAASVYAENPPLINACRKPGEWQTYDIIFHQPIWDGDTLKHPGSVTVLHNGVLAQDHWEFEGLSTHCIRKPLKPYANRLPLSLQDHGNPIRFRNIWIREIPSRYANNTHGGVMADETAVMQLRRATAAKLFQAVNLEKANTPEALSQILEVISYDKDEKYLTTLKSLIDAYLPTLTGLNAPELNARKAELIKLRNECNVLIRNHVMPENCRLKVGLQRLIDDHKLEQKK